MSVGQRGPQCQQVGACGCSAILFSPRLRTTAGFLLLLGIFPRLLAASVFPPEGRRKLWGASVPLGSPLGPQGGAKARAEKRSGAGRREPPKWVPIVTGTQGCCQHTVAEACPQTWPGSDLPSTHLLQRSGPGPCLCGTGPVTPRAICLLEAKADLSNFSLGSTVGPSPML